MSGGRITLAIYIAIGITGAAFGQQSTHPKNVPPPTTYSPIPPSMEQAFTPSNPLLEQLATQSAGKTAEIGRLGAAPITAPPSNAMLQAPIVISFGRGGRVDEHRERFAAYQRNSAKVQVRGPCYSACTFLLAYVEPKNLCIAEGAFMAFHAIRSSEYGDILVGATHQFYADMPPVIRMWIDDNGGWQNLPLNGYWTMHDRQLWARGYPRCAP